MSGERSPESEPEQEPTLPEQAAEAGPETGATGPEDTDLITDPLADAERPQSTTPRPPLKDIGDRGNQIAQVLMCIFMIALAGLLSGYNALYVPFHGEDLRLFVEHDALQRLVTVPEAWGLLPYAPLTLAGYAFNWILAPYNVTVMHWGSLLLHLANGVLLFLVARQLLPRKSAEPVAMLAGLAFVVHPAHVESLAMLAGRPLIQGAFFALLAIYLFQRLAQTKQPGLDAVSWPFAAILLCYALAVGSHFGMILLPVLLWSLYVITSPSETCSAAALRIQRHTLRWVSVLGGILLLVLLNRGALMAMEFRTGVTALSALVPQGLRNLFPVATSDPIHAHAGTLALNGVGMLLFVLLAVAIGVLLWRKHALGVPLLWFGLGLIMLLPALSAEVVMAQRNLYFAVAGAMLLLPMLVVGLAQRGGKQGAGIAASLLLLLVVYGLYSSYVHTLQWRFPESFWAHAAEQYPEDPRPWEYLGAYYRQQTQFAETPQEAGEWLGKQVQAWGAVLERNPESLMAHAALGKALQAQGLPREAEAHLEQALRLNPDDGELSMRLANVHESEFPELGEAALIRAIDLYEHAEAHGFMPPEGRIQYAQLAMYFGDIDKSLALLESVRAFELDDDTPLAGRVQQIRTMRNQQEAMKQQVAQVAMEQPGSIEALLMRAEYQLFVGDRLRTFYLLDGLLQREPENREAWTLMGVVRAALGQTGDFIQERGMQHLADREAWRALIVRCLSGGQFEEAETYSAHYLAHQTAETLPTDMRPELLMADFALELQQAMLAGMVLQQLAEEEPDNYAPWLRLARIARQQDNQAAYQEYTREAAQRGAPADALEALAEDREPVTASPLPAPLLPDTDVEAEDFEDTDVVAPETVPDDEEEVEEEEEALPEVPRVILR